MRFCHKPEFQPFLQRLNQCSIFILCYYFTIAGFCSQDYCNKNESHCCSDLCFQYLVGIHGMNGCFYLSTFPNKRGVFIHQVWIVFSFYNIQRVPNTNAELNWYHYYKSMSTFLSQKNWGFLGTSVKKIAYYLFFQIKNACRRKWYNILSLENNLISCW